MPLSLPPLPALQALPALRQALAASRAAVFSAPPGSGKTTALPLALLQEPWLQGRRILMLEPRRLAARAAAARMAQLLGEAVGQTVGYQIRFERRVSSQTRIEVITEGLLTRRLQSDPELPDIGLLIFDEFHERSLDADLALALALDTRETLRPDLRLMVMSATLAVDQVAALLGDAPRVEAPGRQFPVTVQYLPPKSAESLEQSVVAGVAAALAGTDGDVLAFLPGGREIRACERLLGERLAADLRLCPLHGQLSSEQQDAALAPDPQGRRKVILATNIAQTSLTVEGVTAVVDSGYARAAHYDLGSGANRLQTSRVSRASAEQRAGRAGRLQPGVAYRLWSKEQHGLLAPHDTPEILRVDLSGLALELVAWGLRDPLQARMLDAPPAVAWAAATTLLQALGAIAEDGRVTAHGRQLLRLATEPRRAHMLLLGRDHGAASAAAWTAAVLDERDVLPGADLADSVVAYVAGRVRDSAAQRRVREAARQLARTLGVELQATVDERDVGRMVALAYPERVAQRRDKQRGVYLCADGSEAQLPQRDPLAQQAWLAIAHWDPQPPRRIRAAASIDPEQLETDFAGQLVWQRHVHWDRHQHAVVAEQRRCLGAIVLQRQAVRAQPDEMHAAWREGLGLLGIGALPWTDAARQWQARVLSLRLWHPEETWPDVSDQALAERLDEWLLPYLEGSSRREHLARLDLMALLASMLDYPAQQRLSQRAPTQLQVPSGSRVALAYAADGSPPVLPVKLQELFSLSATPAVDDGRMPVMLHLLSPARRPVQVTADLAGFWARTYPQIRKELKGRYPRHPWPDDPLTAPPSARAKPRGS